MEQYVVQFPKLGLSMKLTREAFVIGDFSIYWYAVLISIGAVLAVIYALKSAKKFGVDPDRLTDIIISAIVFGIIGARVYYVAFNFKNYTRFVDMINLRDGGLAIYGAILFGIAAGFITARIHKTRFLPVMDVCAGGLLIGQAIGRWGNFVNQEAFGVNTSLPFGMYSVKTQAYLETVEWDLFKQGIDVDPTAPVHPCFLHESIWCVIGFLLILLYKKHRKFDGEIFLFYTAWYGAGRAVIEGLRTDSLMLGTVRVSQALSIVAAATALALILFFRIKKARSNDPDYLKLYVLTEESRAQFLKDDEKALDLVETHLNDAQTALNSAREKLGAMSAETDIKESAASEALALADKLTDLAMTHLSLADSMLEQLAAPADAAEQHDDGISDTAEISGVPENDNAAADAPETPEAHSTPDDAPETSEDDSLESRLEQIDSAEEFLQDCAQRLSAERQKRTPACPEQDELSDLSQDYSESQDEPEAAADSAEVTADSAEVTADSAEAAADSAEAAADSAEAAADSAEAAADSAEAAEDSAEADTNSKSPKQED